MDIIQTAASHTGNFTNPPDPPPGTAPARTPLLLPTPPHEQLVGQPLTEGRAPAAPCPAPSASHKGMAGICTPSESTAREAATRKTPAEVGVHTGGCRTASRSRDHSNLPQMSSFPLPKRACTSA